MIKHLKLYLVLGFLYLLFIGFMVVLTLYKVITILSFSIFMLIIIVVPVLIIMLLYFINKGKKKKDEDIDLFKRKRTLDSILVVNWAKDYMRRNYITELDVKKQHTFQFGESHERTTILHLQVYGVTSHNYYDILVNAFDKDLFTIESGQNDYNFVIKLAEHLAFAPVYRPKKIITRMEPEGAETRIEEELVMSNTKEEKPKGEAKIGNENK